jgi:hypothetical protein
MENVLTKEVKDPSLRCQALMHNGTEQCMYRVVEGSTRCILHGGHHAAKRLEEAKIKNYQLRCYQKRVSELSNSDAIKSLREEIGILRMLLETIVNKCEDDNDLLMYAPKIASLAEKIEKLVVSCHRLESSLGFLMDKSTVLNISKEIINIISIHINDPTKLDLISDDIISLIGQE